jgi:SAM-dependent methyltransferase
MSSLRQRLLAQPAVYRTFKSLIARSGAVAQVVHEHLETPPGARILDVGCGYGDYAEHFADRTYLGIDHNEAYLEVARRLNPGVTFVVGDAADLHVRDRGPFDLVFVSGVLHHLDDDEVRALARTTASILAPGGRFVALEPEFLAGQPLSARLIVAADRGQHVRDARGYLTLLEPCFAEIRTAHRDDLLRTPYNHLVIDARAPVT